MDEIIKGQVFLVGCARSGTTLLQSMLTAHPEIASFPESHLFQNLRIPYWSRLLRLASPKARNCLNKFLQNINQEQQQLPKQAWFIDQYVSVFIEALQQATQQQGKRIWVEKSTEHAFYIKMIERYIPKAKFIHIVRNGADVVASLYEVRKKYQQLEVWGESWDVDRCIEHWLKSIKFTSKYLHQPNQLLVRYEKLVVDPESVMREICKFLEVEFNEAMLKKYAEASQQVVEKEELWKVSVKKPIQNANGKKFYELFDEQQREHIINRVSVVNLDELKEQKILWK